ncbi:hypothetical protein AC623_18135 [Bacillus sp. FJAT-27231]|uniref:hypothetical protein n=1 Tax=Bacillus sp. FJAT-27231 TaxID=1679168 RepID=UPI000671553C|nr:hypothetical protein [Bacillus sp. FJAT-27231]KMY55614.1 hypothetical protein AC623_18135 [Bacillus sp. FJAT-27231]
MSDSIEKMTRKIHLNGDHISELHEDAAQLVTEAESISAGSEESAASSRQVAMPMQEQTRDCEKILLSVDEMNQLVQHLNELVVKFRI